MKKMWLMFLMVVIASALPASAGAASEAAGKTMWDGMYAGDVYSSNGSSAPLVLELIELDDEIAAQASIGEGLSVNVGMCGGLVSLPAGSYRGSAHIENLKSNTLETQIVMEVSGFEITTALVSELSQSGEVLDAEVTVDLPWLCGRDPSFKGSLIRINPELLQFQNQQPGFRPQIHKEYSPWS